MKLIPTSAYGIRANRNGSSLVMHYDKVMVMMIMVVITIFVSMMVVTMMVLFRSVMLMVVFFVLCMFR